MPINSLSNIMANLQRGRGAMAPVIPAQFTDELTNILGGATPSPNLEDVPGIVELNSPSPLHNWQFGPPTLQSPPYQSPLPPNFGADPAKNIALIPETGFGELYNNSPIADSPKQYSSDPGPFRRGRSISPPNTYLEETFPAEDYGQPTYELPPPTDYNELLSALGMNPEAPATPSEPQGTGSTIMDWLGFDTPKNEGRFTDLGDTLIDLGARMMAGDSPHFFQNVGEAVLGTNQMLETKADTRFAKDMALAQYDQKEREMKLDIFDSIAQLQQQDEALALQRYGIDKQSSGVQTTSFQTGADGSIYLITVDQAGRPSKVDLGIKAPQGAVNDPVFNAYLDTVKAVFESGGTVADVPPFAEFMQAFGM